MGLGSYLDRKKSQDCARKLEMLSKTDPIETFNQAQAMLYEGINSGNAGLLEVARQYGAKSNNDTYKLAAQMALHRSVQQGDFEMAKVALQEGADPNLGASFLSKWPKMQGLLAEHGAEIRTNAEPAFRKPEGIVDTMRYYAQALIGNLMGMSKEDSLREYAISNQEIPVRESSQELLDPKHMMQVMNLDAKQISNRELLRGTWLDRQVSKYEQCGCSLNSLMSGEGERAITEMKRQGLGGKLTAAMVRNDMEEISRVLAVPIQPALRTR